MFDLCCAALHSCHLDNRPRNANSSELTRFPIQCLHEHETFADANGIRQQVKYLSIESHLSVTSIPKPSQFVAE